MAETNLHPDCQDVNCRYPRCACVAPERRDDKPVPADDLRYGDHCQRCNAASGIDPCPNAGEDCPIARNVLPPNYYTLRAATRSSTGEPADLAAAVRAYDRAINSCGNDPEKMASFCSATGDDLDTLYFAMVNLAHRPSPVSAIKTPDSEPHSQPLPPDAAAAVRELAEVDRALASLGVWPAFIDHTDQDGTPLHDALTRAGTILLHLAPISRADGRTAT